MDIRLSPQGVQLDHPQDFKSFKLIVQGDWPALEAVRAALDGIARLPDRETAWVAQDGLCRVAGDLATPQWRVAVGAMLEKARPYGWVDAATGDIKAHVVWAPA